MNIIYLYLGGCVIGGGIAGILTAIAESPRDREQAPENEGRAGSILDGYDLPEREEGAGVYGALLGAFRSLQEQRAAGFRGWISACIKQYQAGTDVPKETALLALRWTLEELEGRRYDLTGLNKAIAELESEI